MPIWESRYGGSISIFFQLLTKVSSNTSCDGNDNVGSIHQKKTVALHSVQNYPSSSSPWNGTENTPTPCSKAEDEKEENKNPCLLSIQQPFLFPLCTVYIDCFEPAEGRPGKNRMRASTPLSSSSLQCALNQITLVHDGGGQKKGRGEVSRIMRTFEQFSSS